MDKWMKCFNPCFNGYSTLTFKDTGLYVGIVWRVSILVLMDTLL